MTRLPTQRYLVAANSSPSQLKVGSRRFCHQKGHGNDLCCKHLRESIVSEKDSFQGAQMTAAARISNPRSWLWAARQTFCLGSTLVERSKTVLPAQL
jgi:hypothetical protein